MNADIESPVVNEARGEGFMDEAEFELEAELEDLMAVLVKSDLQSEAELFAPFDLVREEAIIADLIARGVRNENQITDAVFFDRHQERNGRRLRSDETVLIRQWFEIRDRLVRPTLYRSAHVQPTAPHGSAAPWGGGGAQSQATASVADDDVRLGHQIANKHVPGMPGVTIQQLLESYRSQFAPEIPLPVLLAFLRYESGGNFDDMTHGVLVGLDEHGNRVKRGKKPVRIIRSPDFYELGLFQIPAGLHGCTAEEPPRNCYPPPGMEKPRDPSEWVKLCNLIGANPAHWRDPTTQVHVGLLNLEGPARVIRKTNPDLFSVPGNDWDLRAAVLLPFAGGRGYTQKFLNRYRSDLASLPEEQRWGLLRGKISSDYAKNIDEKMLLAAKLGYHP
jgi:hypothetical protein